MSLCPNSIRRQYYLETFRQANGRSSKISYARIRLLYYIWKIGWKGNISQLARKTGKNAGNTNKYVHALVQSGLLHEDSYQLTKQGRQQIAYLIFSSLLLYLTPVVFILPIIWGFNGMMTGQLTSPITLIVYGISMIGMFAFLARLHKQAEKHYWETII